jgi:tetratricopeptide (TPR) repeat protein
VLSSVFEEFKLPLDRTKAIAAGQSLAKSLHSLDRLEDTESIYRWICDSGLERCAETDSTLPDSLQSLGQVLLERKNFVAAATDLKRAWGLREKHLEPDYDRRLEACELYCKVLAGNEDYASIEILIRELWERRQNSVRTEGTRKDQLRAFDGGHVYGIVLLKQRNFTKAETILRQVLDGRVQILGREHVDTLESSEAYANALVKQNDRHQRLKAESILSETWHIKDSFRDKPESAYSTVLDIGCALASRLRKLKKYKHALKVIDDAYRLKAAQLEVKELMPDHPFTIALRKIQRSVKESMVSTGTSTKP